MRIRYRCIIPVSSLKDAIFIWSWKCEGFFIQAVNTRQNFIAAGEIVLAPLKCVLCY